jgi:hypothetical protein
MATKRRAPVPIGSLVLAATQGLCASPHHPPGEHPTSGDLATMPPKLAKRILAIAKAVKIELDAEPDEEW